MYADPITIVLMPWLRLLSSNTSLSQDLKPLPPLPKHVKTNDGIDIPMPKANILCQFPSP